MATFPSITPTYGQQKRSQPNTRTVRFADFQPPGESSTSKFVCETWSKSIPYLNRATIQATFREVFEP
jgi:hypothetical protein